MRAGLRCAVLGKPIAHSLSPVLHRAAYDAIGLDWHYDAIEMDEDGLADFLAGLNDSWRGLSLTMPLKRRVLDLVGAADDVDRWARLAHAANTLVLGPTRLVANTDVPGAISVIEGLDLPIRSAVLLGGGATAGSVLVALAELGCARATVLAREPSRADEAVAAAARHPARMPVDVGRLDTLLAERAPLGLLAGADLLVSTVPAAAQTPALVDAVSGVPAVFEVVYDPWPTPLAAAARASGRALAGGLDLLVAQAALQVQLMTGVDEAPVSAMRAAGERALAARA